VRTEQQIVAFRSAKVALPDATFAERKATISKATYPKQAAQSMSPVTCPDNETLKSLLLGKLTGSQLSQWEKHLLHCESCASKAETLDGRDALTEAIVSGNFPSGDEEVLSAAIEQAKLLASMLDTVRISDTDAGHFSAPDSASVQSEKSRYKLEFLAPAQQPDELGRLGDYRLLRVLGVGGMGIVFKGEDIRLERPVALKVMRPGVAAKRDAKARFLREARATASLSHDHIVQIFQVGEHDGVPFIAMQYLAGESLETRLKRIGKLSDDEVIRIGKGIASGLAAAHEAGMIHRDIKPDNIWMELKTDRAKILDFGLVRDDHSDEGLTQSGAILGTPRYMAPEQVAGEKVDHRADLFSLGSLLYHLAAGKPPFTGPTIPALLYAIAHSPPQPLAESSPQINQALADLIMRLLGKQITDRPDSAAQVADELARIEPELTAPQTAGQQKHKPPHDRWPLVASAGAAALAIMLAVIVITIRSRDGKQTKIEIAEGTSTNLDLAPGTEVTIEQKSPQATTSPASQIDPEKDSPSTQGIQPPLANVPFSASEAKSEKPTVAAAIPTAEEINAVHPPLDRWLDGREILSVAQDGSAMFTTIQAALDAQKDGQVVQVMDKGPYRESLQWHNKKDCGLISEVQTVVESHDWVKTDSTSSTFLGAVVLKNVQASRLQGFTFISFPTKYHHLRPLFLSETPGLCVDSCVVLPVLQRNAEQPRTLDVHFWFTPTYGFPPICVRNSVIATGNLIFWGKKADNSVCQVYCYHNWIRSYGACLSAPDTLPTIGAGLNVGAYSHTTVSNFSFGFVNNVIEIIDSAHEPIFSGEGFRLQFHSNTIINPTRGVLAARQAISADCSFVDNLSFTQFNDVSFPDNDVNKLISVAKKHWEIRNNYVNAGPRNGDAFLALSDSRAEQIRLYSTDPVNRNFIRVDPDSLSVPLGDPFPGALPPGPAPPEGDWFTRGQERFADALKFIPVEEHEKWTQPIEIANIGSQAANGTAQRGPVKDNQSTQNIQPPLAILPFSASEAKSHQAAWSAYLDQPIEITNSIGMKLVLIPPGQFLMGSTKTPEALVELFPGSSIHWFQREHPNHTVKITQPYFLGAHEVTVGNFKKFIDATGYQTTAEGVGNARIYKNGEWLYQQGANWRDPGFAQDATHPASCVSWLDAIAFCEWLSKQEGRAYGLPTEAQWEYACRAGTVTEYFWGDDPDLGDGYLNAGDVTGKLETRAFRLKPTELPMHLAIGTAPVGSFKPNNFGLYDMAGNLWESCSDWSSDYLPDDQEDPIGPDSARRRASRGAAWASESWNWRSSFRSRSSPTYSCADFGFRVVLTVQPSETDK